MTIDTQRLETDPDYWRECGAPEDATGAFVLEIFTGDEILLFGSGKVEVKHSDKLENLYSVTAAISRPQAPEAEWVDGLPEIGEKMEYYNDKMNEIRGCEVIAHRHGCAIVEDQDGVTYEAVPPNEFVRTKQERQRDELVSVISSALDECYVNGGMEPSDVISDSDTRVYSEAVADAIIADGWTKP